MATPELSLCPLRWQFVEKILGKSLESRKAAVGPKTATQMKTKMRAYLWSILGVRLAQK